MKKILLFCLVLLVGCAGRMFSFKQVRQVKPGMTEADVKQIMGGNPYSITAIGGQTTWVYAYGTAWGSSAAASFVFSNKVVISVPEVPDSF